MNSREAAKRAGRAGERFPPEARVRRARDIRRALRKGRRVRKGPLDLFAVPSAAGRARVGIIVPRHGRSIAERNRLKRRLREIARRDLLPRALAAGTAEDLVLRARPSAYGLPFQRLRDALKDYPPAAGEPSISDHDKAAAGDPC